MALFKFRLPDIGEGIAEAEIVGLRRTRIWPT
jgi:pyruvate/2-oxoglutarate dehydrogenase complex dihydrolipoamide acyltransferase (E2) component